MTENGNEKTQRTHEQSDNEQTSGETGEDGDRIIVSVPASKSDTGNDADEDQEIERIVERIEALDARITSALKDERQWSEKTITSLKQEVADLKATLTEAAKNLPQQMKELKAELIRLSQEIQHRVQTPPATQEALPAVEQIDPPLSPPDPNNALPASPEGTQEHVSAISVPQSVPAVRRPWVKRVI